MFDRNAALAWAPAAPRLSHRPGLDGLRAIAVLAVLGYHLGIGGFTGGFLGVEVFFTLSGYLVTALLLVEVRRAGRIDLRRFAGARARRLVPALLVCLAGTAAAGTVAHPAGFAGLRAQLLASLLYLQNWHLIIAEVPYSAAFDNPAPLLHLWSLAIEAQLYLLWPVVLAGCLAALGRRRTVVVIATLVALSALAAAALFDPDAPGRVYYGTDTRASGFLIGAVLAVVQAGAERRTTAITTQTRSRLGVAALVGLLAMFVLVSEFDERLYRQGGLAVVGLLTAFVIAAAVEPLSSPGRLLGTAPLVWLGRRSYGIYLYHWPIVALSEPLARTGAGLLVTLAQIAATLLVAAASYRWVELPIRRARRRPRRYRRPDAVLFAAATVAVVMMTGTSMGAAVAMTKSPLHVGGVLWDALLSPAGAVPAEVPERAPAEPAPGPVLVLGDSVVLGSAAALRDTLGPDTVVDGVSGRQFSAAPAIVARWTARNSGPVVVHLGSNGPIRNTDIDAIVAAAGERRVVFVNVAVPRRWQQPDNAILAAAAVRHSGRIQLVDWAGMVNGNAALLARDRVHPVPAGRTALAEAVRAALGQ